MNLPYFGALPINVTLVQAAGTRRELVDWIATQAAAAGWTYVSGQGTGTPKLRSAITPHGIRCKFSMSDVSNGTNATLFPITDDDASTFGPHYLVPAIGTTWRMIASPYYLRVFQDLATVGSRDFVCFENLWIPARFRGTVTEAFFTSANSETNIPTNAATRPSLRNLMHNSGAWSNSVCAFNSNRWGTGGGATGGGALNITLPGIANGNTAGNFTSGPRTWMDGSVSILDAPVSWGLTSITDGVTSQRGVIGDALIYCSPLAFGTVIVVDGQRWFAFNGSGGQPYTLCYLIP